MEDDVRLQMLNFRLRSDFPKGVVIRGAGGGGEGVWLVHSVFMEKYVRLGHADQQVLGKS